jgi:hypothetical protein
MDARSVTSMSSGVTESPISARNRSASDDFLTLANTCHPDLASFATVAQPMPLDAPVTTTVLLSIIVNPPYFGDDGERDAIHF